ncbi:LysR family transcriptional regulator [Agarivorans sp. MS3-6]|uniref:LysR family transcriptional regulator n=1 Tax=Agarivorans sp. TSD2052 TaxID=2937286 RepID=UPI00200C1009|nr:LysR family transcriptional regulator [Agarivorans sp. TSD2052]UPW17525.1 LysR family transcriptional regulator [Agarivorans sp. TSD2052]
MNWSIDQLQAFVSAAQLGSFSAAARKLGKAQSRVSTAIANLEADLGFELYDRSAKLPVLTPLGQQMLPEAQLVLEQCHRLQSRALTAANKEPISLKIAIDEAIPIEAIHSMFMRIGEQFPYLQLTVTNGTQDDISAAIENKQLDIGLMLSQKALPDNVMFSSLGYVELVLIVGMQHPLTKLTSISYQHLQKYRQLVQCNREGLGSSTPISPSHWYVDSFYLISELVAKNQGWAIVPQHIAQNDWIEGAIQVVHCDSLLANMKFEIGIVKRCDSPDSKLSTWLVAELLKLISNDS